MDGQQILQTISHKYCFSLQSFRKVLMAVSLRLYFLIRTWKAVIPGSQLKAKEFSDEGYLNAYVYVKQVKLLRKVILSNKACLLFLSSSSQSHLFLFINIANEAKIATHA